VQAEQRLEELYAAAASSWPGLSVPAERFAEYVRARLPAGGDGGATVEGMQLGDLYLACACVLGVSGALQRFEQAHFVEVDRAYGRIGSPPVQLSDAQQMLREKLFVSKDGKPPKISEYSGQGPLRVWVRVAAMRMLQNLVVRGPKEKPLEGELLAEVPAAANDPELEHMRQLYRSEFKQAFGQAVAALGLNDRILLHQRFVGQLSLEELAAAYDVHVNTVGRWLSRARQTLEAGIRGALSARLQVSETQFRSILRLVQSQLDVTLGQLLAPEDGPAGRGS
jgi:RNA polymerase sigma-70 factor, ECF subfamily